MKKYFGLILLFFTSLTFGWTQTRMVDVNRSSLLLLRDSCGFNFEIDVLRECCVDTSEIIDTSHFEAQACIDKWQSLYGECDCHFGDVGVFTCRGAQWVAVFGGLSSGSVGMYGGYYEFYPNGRVKNKLIFSRNRLNDEGFYYYPTGDTIPSSLTYTHGAEQSKFEFNKGTLWKVKAIYSPSGISLKIGQFNNGNGKLNFYDNRGQLYATMTYLAGRSNGIAQFYSSEGKFYIECNIIEGEIIGTCIVYNSRKEAIRTFNNNHED